MEKGSLYLIPTPIGNLDDISKRAIETLKMVDIILCEDTRHSSKLLNHLGINKRLYSYYEHNEKMRAEEAIEWLKQGVNIGLITDAGMPAVSDPGYIIVDLVHKNELKVYAIPGANAALTALVLSGFDSWRFQFIGFLPRQNSKKREELLETINYNGLTIIYESPNRLMHTLKMMEEIFPDRRIFIAREITKLYEEHFRGRVVDAALHFGSKEIKGEIVIVLDSFEAETEEVDIAAEFQKLLDNGIKKSQAVKEVSAKYGINKNEVYKVSLEL